MLASARAEGGAGGTAGELAGKEGSVEEGQDVRKAVFAQDLAQDLPLEKSALDYVLEQARALDPLVPMEAGRTVLGALGLTDATPLRPIGAWRALLPRSPGPGQTLAPDAIRLHVVERLRKTRAPWTL